MNILGLTDWQMSPDETPRPCFCVGPQPGHTLCPCAERAEAVYRWKIQNPLLQRIRELEDEIAHLKRTKK